MKLLNYYYNKTRNSINTIKHFYKLVTRACDEKRHFQNKLIDGKRLLRWQKEL